MTEQAEQAGTAHLGLPPGPPGHPHSDVPPPLDPASTEIPPLDVVVVTGLSGAGKNSAGRVLEDLGWFVVDNLPPALLLPMVQLGARGDVRRFGAVVDVRSRAFSSDLQEAIRVLAEAGPRPRVVYVHARGDAAVRLESVVRSCVVVLPCTG